MDSLTNLLMFFAIVSLTFGANPYPNQDWDSELIDLGNGGDAIFYCLIKCQYRSINAPLLIWLAGGPGSSSLQHSFLTNGPYVLNSSLKFEENPYTWAKKVDIMYVDNPVGVPFSIAKDNTTLCKTQKCVVKNLFTFFLKFLERHPEYIRRPLYLSGESYAGHYVPAFAAHLTRINHPYINFIGGAVGNGLMSLYEQNPYYSEYLLYNKNISLAFYSIMKLSELMCEASRVAKIELFDDLCPFTAFLLITIAGFENPYDITQQNTTETKIKVKWLINYINSTEIKKAYGVEKYNYDTGSDEVAIAMTHDIALSLLNDIAFCLDSGKKMIFWFGDKDYVCNWMGGHNVVRKIPWKGNQEFNKQNLTDWIDEKGNNIGKMQSFGKLTYIKLYNGGHSIFQRQRAAGLQLLNELLK